jgi:PIN domain nuclease of toxin-antitoxin system
MKILLDTHTFLWGLSDVNRLSERVRELLPSAETWFSVASLWEILIKSQSGKLPLPQPSGAYVMAKLKVNGVKLLPVKLDHVLRIESLPMHHRDPFDRMLIAQSLEEKLPLVTADPLILRYPVEVIW